MKREIFDVAFVLRTGVAAGMGAMACSPAAKDKTARSASSDASTATQPTAAAVASAGTSRAKRSASTVLFVGTSLTAGLGLDPAQAYPALVEAKADSAGLPIRAINAGVSGETSAGALNRIDWVLRQPADIVVIETGANDGLRALPVAAARRNISAILDSVKKAKPHAQLFLVQMEAPPNLGIAYTRAFHDMYGELAREKGATLIPFLLGGVAGNAALNQADGVHPNARGERIVAETVWKALLPALRAG